MHTASPLVPSLNVPGGSAACASIKAVVAHKSSTKAINGCNERLFVEIVDMLLVYCKGLETFSLHVDWLPIMAALFGKPIKISNL